MYYTMRSRRPPCSFHLGDPEVNCPPSPSPSHTASVRHLLRKQGHLQQLQGAPIFQFPTHSDVIDNRKPLCGADDFFFFKCSCRTPRVMKKCRSGWLPGSPVSKTASAHFTSELLRSRKSCMAVQVWSLGSAVKAQEK